MGENRPLESLVLLLSGIQFNRKSIEFYQFTVSERHDPIMTRSTTTRIEDLESSVGSIKVNQQSIQESLEKIVQEIAKISKQQDEVSSQLNSVQSSIDEGSSGSGGKVKNSDDKHDPNRFFVG